MEHYAIKFPEERRMGHFRGAVYGLVAAIGALVLSAFYQDPIFLVLNSIGVDPKNLTSVQIVTMVAITAFLVGAAFGILVVEREHLQTFLQARRINNLRQLESILGRPVVGWVPDARHHAYEDLRDVKSATIESISSIASAIQATAGRTSVSLLVTSGGPTEGKTTVANGLARVQARKGLKVLLVDGDLRSPSAHRLFDLPQAPGLTSVAMGACGLSDAIQKTDVEGLDLLPAGHLPPAPDAILDRLQVAGAWQQMEELYDWVIIDAPPVMGLADVPMMVRSVKVVLYVVRHRHWRASVITSAYKRLQVGEQQHIMVAGTALPTKGFQYGYAYGYAYGYGYGYSFDYGAASAGTVIASEGAAPTVEAQPSRQTQPSKERWLAGFWERHGLAVIIYSALLFFFGLIIYLLVQLADWMVPDRTTDVGHGVVASARRGAVVEVVAHYEDVATAEARLDLIGDTAQRLARWTANGLDDLPAAVRTVQLRASFHTPDRLGNSSYPTYLIVSFSREDLEHVNVKALRGTAFLNIAAAARASDVGAYVQLRKYCMERSGRVVSAAFCSTLAGPAPHRREKLSL